MVIALGGCAASHQTKPPTGRPSHTRSVALAAHLFLASGLYGVGNLSCDGPTVAWSTSSQPRSSLNNLIRTAPFPSGTATIAGRAQYGGTLTAPLKVSGNWVVYLEYKQFSETFSDVFWYLRAANFVTGQVLVLAHAQSPSGTEPPFYSISGNLVVWNQVAPTGHEELVEYDLRSHTAHSVRLPSGVSPTQPQIAGGRVAFLNTSVNPHAAQEPFFSRGGAPSVLDLATGRVTRLSSATQAQTIAFNGSMVAWSNTVPDPVNPPPAVVPDVRLTSASGGPTRVIGAVGYSLAMDGKYVVWYDAENGRIYSYALGVNREVSITISGQSSFGNGSSAVCGDRLFFALPPSAAGPNGPLDPRAQSFIRYVNLSEAFRP